MAMNDTPRTIYLPSTGGYTSSRIVPESIDRRRFPLRRYSIDEDGNLVCRTRNVNKEARPRPYNASPRATARELPPRPQTPVFTQPHTHPSESSTVVQVLNNLIPEIMRDPDCFRESIPTVCAEHNIDPTVLHSFVQNLTSAQLASNPPKDLPRPPDQPPVAPISAPTPSSTTPVTPFKQERSFASGSPGITAWYTSSSYDDIPAPGPGLDPKVGDLYVHTNRATDHREVWLFDMGRDWKCVTNVVKVYHPVIADRVLSIRANGTPSWITAASYMTIRGRKARVAE